MYIKFATCTWAMCIMLVTEVEQCIYTLQLVLGQCI